MDDRSLDLLIALSWLGIATKEQLRRLCCPEVSLKTLERCLSGLESRNPPLISSRKRASRTSEGTRRLPTMYFLAEEAHGLLLQRDDYPRRTANGQYPIKAGGPRAEHLVEHDLQVVEAVISLVVAARQQRLSGVFLARELRIGTSAGTLIPDAVLLLQFGGVVGERAVPWTKVPSVGATVLSFAIESDRATEPHSTIAGKAALYRELNSLKDRQQWEERFRCQVPSPFWIAHTPQRADAINNVWLKAWPRGSWIVTAPEELAETRALQVLEGVVRRVRLFSGPVCSDDRPAAPWPAPTATLTPSRAPSSSSTPPGSQPARVEATAAARPPQATPSQQAPSVQQGATPQSERTTSTPTPAAAPPPRRRILPEDGFAPARPAAASSPAQPPRSKLAQVAPLPAFPAWLTPHRYDDPALNIARCIGLALWLPLWAALTFTERSLYGLVQLDELMVERLGRLRAALVWLCVIGLLVATSWMASGAGRLRLAHEQPPLPAAWATSEPVPELPPPAIAEPEPTEIPCEPAIVTANRVHLRLAPGMDTEIATRRLSAGERVEVCGDLVEVDDHRWRLVRTENGGGGYVSDLYLELVEQPQEQTDASAPEE